MKEKSPVGRIWEMGEKEHGKLITAVILAVLGVACGMAPYFAAAKIIVLLLAGEKVFLAYLPWLLTAFGGFLLRTVLYNGALGISHRATFSILKTIREKLLAKLPRLPLGTVMDTSSGKLKEIIVDQVDSMETTLAHLFPEMTANIVTPLLTVIYLFVLDWRLALLSLAVFPIAGILSMALGVQTLKLGGITLKGILQAENISEKGVYAAMAAGMIFCAGEAVLAKFAEHYFRRELSDGTPFTSGGAGEMMRLGILAVCIPIGIQIIVSIIYAASRQAVQGTIDFGSSGSVALGIMFIVMSVICRYGAEQCKKTDEGQ